jgi:hypothetical protein
MLSRTQDKILKGKERQRAFIASLRSHICGFNHTKFKTLVEAFKFFDKVLLFDLIFKFHLLIEF